MNVTGDWPRPITLRTGWAKAVARPWNDDIPDAHLRLVRGSAGFIERCVGILGRFGVDGVTSPPLLKENRGIWDRAGFEDHLRLVLMRRTLPTRFDRPDIPVDLLSEIPWPSLVHIDGLAFDEVWRMNEDGLKEAWDATVHSAVLATRDDDQIVGFAIVGIAGTTAYLQRIAVDPCQQGRGLGRSMLRASMAWAAQRNAATMLLNTQPDNETSAALYEDEGFHRIDPGLIVLRAAVESTTD